MIYVDVFDQLQNVAQIARNCPTPTLRNAYVTAMRDWCSQTRWLRATIPGITAVGESLYDLGSDPFIEMLALVAVSGASDSPAAKWVLRSSNTGGWDANVGQSTPRQYAYVPEGQLALFPTPDAVYSITSTVVVQPKSGVVKIPAAPLVKYSSAFEAGALQYLLSMKDSTWFNPAESARQGRIYQSGISNGKAEVQRNYNSGSQRIAPHRFIV